MDEDDVRHELLRETEQDTSITDSLLEYATREELDLFHKLLRRHFDDQLTQLLRRIHRRAIMEEFDRQIDHRLSRVI